MPKGYVTPAHVHQGVLTKLLKHIFPNADTYENIRTLNELSGLEIDVWIPEHRLAFEYQDTYHYVVSWEVQNSQETIKKRDQKKKEIVLANGITLVEVPCWWDGSITSLISSIDFLRPDLRLTASNPISLNPCFDFFKVNDIPNVGEFMLASFFLDVQDVNMHDHWWVGEKYDGIRCCWNPLRNAGYSRNGKQLDFLPSFNNLFPSIFVDSEIWCGRGMFAFVFALSTNNKRDWQQLRVLAFDVPTLDLPFEDRYKQMIDFISPNHPFVIIATRILCSQLHTLYKFTQNLLDHNAEGLILQQLNSLYFPGRTSSLIKLKAYANDQEGLVVARGKHLSSVSIKMADGRIFTVPPQDVLIAPSVGDVVTFSSNNYSRHELPVGPKIIRIRSDLEWDDVVQRSGVENRELSSKKSYTMKPGGYWTFKNMKLFMEKIAREKNLDPHCAETWYSITQREVKRTKGGTTIMDKLGGYFKTLKKLFPNIKFEISKFVKLSSWHSFDNKRKFFEYYARVNNFDPYDPNNWYKQTHKDLGSIKGGQALINKTTLPAVLSTVFPNIGLDVSKFKVYPFRIRENRIKLFESYAKENHFHVHDVNSWYMQPRNKLLAFKGLKSAIWHHKKSYKTALLDLFPDIGFEKDKFR